MGAARADDVTAAVAFAVGHDLPVAVQNTGHGFSVPAEGGLPRHHPAHDHGPRRPGHTKRVRRSRRPLPAAHSRGGTARAGAAERLRPARGRRLLHLGRWSPSARTQPRLGGGPGAGHGRRDRRRRAAPRDPGGQAGPVLGPAGRTGQLSASSRAWSSGLVPVARLYGGGLFYDAEHVPGLRRRTRGWTTTVPGRDELVGGADPLPGRSAGSGADARTPRLAHADRLHRLHRGQHPPGRTAPPARPSAVGEPA